MSPDSLDSLKHSLLQLTPVPPAMDRDRLLFEAGRRSVKRSLHSPFISTVSMLFGFSCLGMWLLQPAEVRREVVYLPRELQATELPSVDVDHVEPVKQETIVSESPFSYLALQREMLRTDRPFPPLPMLTASDNEPAPPLTAGSYLRSLPMR